MRNLSPTILAALFAATAGALAADSAARDPAVEASGAGSFHWTTLSGGVSPGGSAAPFSHALGGCLALENSASLFAGLNLRDGDVITFLRFYFLDTDPAEEVTGRLHAADGAGGLSTLASVSSNGTPGFSSEGTALDYTVDNSAEALVFEAEGNGDDLRVCGFRLVVEPGDRQPVEYWTSAVLAGKSTYHDLSFGHAGGGCVLRNSGGGNDGDFDLEVQLPEGAQISELRYYYYDDDPSLTTSVFYTADALGTIDFSSGILSSGSGFGFGEVPLSHTVSSSSEHLGIRVDLGDGFFGDLRGCRVRLTYTPPEVIFADGFESGDSSAWSTTVM